MTPTAGEWLAVLAIVETSRSPNAARLAAVVQTALDAARATTSPETAPGDAHTAYPTPSATPDPNAPQKTKETP
jgi:hypothetical protein